MTLQVITTLYSLPSWKSFSSTSIFQTLISVVIRCIILRTLNKIFFYSLVTFKNLSVYSSIPNKIHFTRLLVRLLSTLLLSRQVNPLFTSPGPYSITTKGDSISSTPTSSPPSNSPVHLFSRPTPLTNFNSKSLSLLLPLRV